MHKANWQLGLAILLIAACTAEPDATALSDTTTTTRMHASTTLAEDGAAALAGVPESCPVTVPDDNAFTPASETPEGPPEVYDVVWYGTPDLWTMIDSQGEINSKRWLQGDRTFWWSELYSPGDTAEITVSAEHLSGSAPTVMESAQAGRGFNPFMLLPTHESVTMVGVELPEPGCWEITANYKGAVISYVVWLDND